MTKSIFTYLVLLCSYASIYAQDIQVDLYASGFNSPVDIQNAGDDRLFIVEQGGIIKILNSDGTTNPTPFLNIDPIVASGGERGLLGLAFHPEYATNGYFYVYYTDNSSDTQISRFSVSTASPDIADPGSELKMLDFEQPFTNHNGGSLQFGPDGMLFIGSGDGGSGGDPGNRAQTLTTYLGKMLRLDVDAAAPYIPADNPWAGDPSGLDEIWAYGIRNPWRFSFDADTGDLWIADVGQGSREEINKSDPTEAGINYGWRCYEGNAPFNTSGCPSSTTMEFPVAEYTHGSGRCSITGGYVYRGSEYPTLDGLYFFADICTGEIGTVDTANNLTWVINTTDSWSTFGEDINKELYVAGLGGQIYRIIDNALSVDDQNFSASLTWFQDESSTDVVIQSSQRLITQIDLFNMSGAKIGEVTSNGNTQITLVTANMPTGLYLARVSSSTGEVETIKIAIR
ncbi:MAG: PQQ-dependent sugar dehydrogenase [Gilvibacter sp.]